VVIILVSSHMDVVLLLSKVLIISFISHHHKDNSSNDKKNKHGYKNPNPAWHSTIIITIVITTNSSTDFTSVLNTNSISSSSFSSIYGLSNFLDLDISDIGLGFTTSIKCSIRTFRSEFQFNIISFRRSKSSNAGEVVV
jgi:hypothetical protein